MPLRVEPVRAEERQILWNLLQFCLHERSQHEDLEVNELGQFSYPGWEELGGTDGSVPLLVRVKGKLAGLAIIDANQKGDEATYTMRDFFILEGYRGLGISEEIARIIFADRPGKWLIPQREENAALLAFWKQVVWRYTVGKYRETRLQNWTGPVLEFTSVAGNESAFGASESTRPDGSPVPHKPSPQQA